MDKKELYAWMAENEQVFYTEDSCGCNIISYSIYRDSKGDHYKVSFCNGSPDEIYVAGKGYIRGEYQPMPTTQKTRTITETYWE